MNEASLALRPRVGHEYVSKHSRDELVEWLRPHVKDTLKFFKTQSLYLLSDWIYAYLPLSLDLSLFYVIVF